MGQKDLFDPAQAAEPFELGLRFELWQLTFTVAGTGDTMTVDGQWDAYREGTPEPGDPQHQTGIRMVTVTTQDGATPTL